jgi:hypothetical protein
MWKCAKKGEGLWVQRRKCMKLLGGVDVINWKMETGGIGNG